MKSALLHFYKFINQPYPFYANSRQAWLLDLAISVFIAFFCIVFQPFGLDQLPSPLRFWVCAGYGAVTFLITAINMVVLPQIFPNILSEKVWTVYKEVIWVCWMIFTIATANYFYSGLFFDFDPGWGLFFMVQRSTAVIALIPAIGVIFFKQLYMYKKYIHEAERMNQHLFHSLHDFDEQKDVIVIKSKNGKESIEITLEQLLCITATGNYIEVYYSTNTGTAKELFRNKISTVYEQLKGLRGIIRCHRTHIVNLNHVKGVQGNSQGYKLEVNGMDGLIPVARSQSKEIRRFLQ